MVEGVGWGGGLDLFGFSMDFVGNGGFGACPIPPSVWCSPAGGFLSEKCFLSITCFLLFFERCLIKMDLICYELEEPPSKSAS